MTMMNYSTYELLALILGAEEAQRWYDGALSPLFSGEVPSGDPREKLLAARELVVRWLEEGLERGDVLDAPARVREFLRARLSGREHETFTILFLDAQNRLIAAEDLFRGTLTQTSVYPREIVKRALYWNAGAVIFAHNHPSGVAEPSRADELLTSTLRQTLALIDVKVLDHFIVAGSEVASFAERGIL